MGTNITPFRQSIRAKTAPNRRQGASAARKSLQASPLVRKAIELMVWEGHRRDDAAKALGMLPKSLYNAFRKLHVRRFYCDELEVLRTSERARNIHRLCEIRDAGNNMPAVQAIRTLEAMEDDAASTSRERVTPGLTIVIQQPEPGRPVLDVTPSPRPQ